MTAPLLSHGWLSPVSYPCLCLETLLYKVITTRDFLKDRSLSLALMDAETETIERKSTSLVEMSAKADIAIDQVSLPRMQKSMSQSRFCPVPGSDRIIHRSLSWEKEWRDSDMSEDNTEHFCRKRNASQPLRARQYRLRMNVDSSGHNSTRKPATRSQCSYTPPAVVDANNVDHLAMRW